MAKKIKECLHGKFSYYDNDYWIGGALDQEGTYSEEEIQFLLKLVPPNATVVEVGANIGTITVPLAKYLNTGRMVVFEPQPENLALLRENLDQNDMLFVNVREEAVGEICGQKRQIQSIDWDQPKLNSGNRRVLAGNKHNADLHAVKTITLDAGLADYDKIDLIKIDVEGYELKVLKGAADTIKRYRPLLYLENDVPENARALVAHLFKLEYSLWWHFPKLYNPSIAQADQPYISSNVLAIPNDTTQTMSVMELTKSLQPIVSEYDDMLLALMRQKQQEGNQEPPTAKTETNEWACVVRLGGVGDNLIVSAVLPALKKRYRYLEVIASEPQHVVFENNPYVDKLTMKAQGEPPWGDGVSWQRYWLDRSKEYAFFAQLSHSCETFRVLTKVQTQYYWPAKVRRKICGQSYLESAADVVDIPYEELRPQFFPTDLERKSALDLKKRLGGKYIAWILSGTRIDKVWPPAAATIARLLKTTKLPIVMLGGPGKDFEMAKQIQQYVIEVNGSDTGLHLGLSVTPEKPNWPIRRVLTQTLMADLVVTPDTGPAWAVAMEDMPKIVLMSHASPENITKYWKNTKTLMPDALNVPCWPCHLLIDEPADCERLSGKKGGQGAACISDIKPDQVIQAVHTALDVGSVSQFSRK